MKSKNGKLCTTWFEMLIVEIMKDKYTFIDNMTRVTRFWNIILAMIEVFLAGLNDFLGNWFLEKFWLGISIIVPFTIFIWKYYSVELIDICSKDYAFFVIVAAKPLEI